jgi:nuclear GTP-binding protein
MTKKASKRQTLQGKYKIERKIKQHKQKEAKLAKQNQHRRPKAMKSLGIPNMWPGKDNLLRQIEIKRRNEAAEKERLKLKKIADRKVAQRRALAKNSQLAELVSGATEVLAPARPMVDRGMLNNVARRSFYVGFKKVVETADVCLVVLDARDPVGCRCVEAERMLLACGTDKKIVLVLNKIDLVPTLVARKWLNALQSEYPTVAFQANGHHSDVKCPWAGTLVELLHGYWEQRGSNTPLSVGVVGLPNVGKSSLINTLQRTRLTNVGSTPGMTRVFQPVHFDKKLTLLDSPPVVFTNYTGTVTGLRNCAKLDKLVDIEGYVSMILRCCKQEHLMMVYKIGQFEGTPGFLQQIAEVLNKRKKNGDMDVEVAARAVLQDWSDGSIPYYTVPIGKPAKIKDSKLATLVRTAGLCSAKHTHHCLRPHMQSRAVFLQVKRQEEQIGRLASGESGVEMATVGPLCAEWLRGIDEEDEDELQAKLGATHGVRTPRPLHRNSCSAV